MNHLIYPTYCHHSQYITHGSLLIIQPHDQPHGIFEKPSTLGAPQLSPWHVSSAAEFVRMLQLHLQRQTRISGEGETDLSPTCQQSAAQFQPLGSSDVIHGLAPRWFAAGASERMIQFDPMVWG